MTLAIERGIEHRVSSGSLVSVGGKLPYYQELRTSLLLDVLLIISKKGKDERKKINHWLYSRTRPGFYLELNEHLHLAYADQRDGHGTQHWWRLFFDKDYQQKIEDATKANALTAGSKAPEGNNNSASGYDAYREWGGMYFRSQAEIAIAEELDKRNVLFFANIKGRLNYEDLPASKASGYLSGRVEVDFLVFKNSTCIVLEVDGQHHQEGSQTIRDYLRDRVLLREGIPTARFTAQECMNKTVDVITEFLELFSNIMK